MINEDSTRTSTTVASVLFSLEFASLPHGGAVLRKNLTGAKAMGVLRDFQFGVLSGLKNESNEGRWSFFVKRSGAAKLVSGVARG
jgi:hypothetical protein